MRSVFAKLGVVALASTMLIGLAGCAGQESAQTDRQLVVGASAAPDSLDPTTANAAAIPEALLYNVYETLIKISPTGELEPLLAKSYDVSPDRKTYTFHLNDAKFASGKPVTASDVVASVVRIQTDPAVLPTYKDRMSPLDKAVAKDEKTVEMTLKRPSNSWLYAMAQTMGIVFDPAGMDSLTTKPAGSGPFVFDSWVKGDSVVLKRNDNYWKTPTKLAGVTFKYYTDPNAENAAMLSGSLDVVSNVAAPQALDQFKDESRFKILDGVTTGEVVLGFNHQTPALQDLKVRQAINYAIDKKGLRDAVWAGKGPLIGSMVPPTDPWYEDLSNFYPYNPSKAKQLLREAGKEGITLRLRVPTLPYGPSAGAYIASQLKQVGINVKLDELEFPATWVDEVMKKSNYDLTIVAHVESRDMGLWANPDYYWHYNNPAFQQLLKEADEADPERQIQLNKQAARMLAEDAAADFLWLLPHIVVTKKDVTGVYGDAPSLSFDLTQAAIVA